MMEEIANYRAKSKIKQKLESAGYVHSNLGERVFEEVLTLVDPFFE
jgi:hypothetical protein